LAEREQAKTSSAPLSAPRPEPSRASTAAPRSEPPPLPVRKVAAKDAVSPVPSPAALTAFDRSELPPGLIVAGRYEIQGRLGRGGMGIVYGVRHVVTGEHLALKVLHPSLVDNPGAVERFRTEARAPLRIGTEHVVKVIEADVCGEIGDVPFMVMERLEGRDFASELKVRGALPAGEVCVYLTQVAETLDRAHAVGIIHRDLKPANLFLTRTDDGSPLVKILDFGIAKLADAASADLTQDGCVFGTPWFMSPEQASGNSRGVGPAADLWALGLLAYRLLTGRNYWTGEGIVALIAQIVHQPMRPPSQSAPHLGPMFDVWFARACNREIEHRFESAGEQIRQLAKALGVHGNATEASNSAIGATIHIDICLPEQDKQRSEDASAPPSASAPPPVSRPWSVPPLSATRPPEPHARGRGTTTPVFAMSVAIALCVGAAATFFVLHRPRVDPRAAQSAAAPPNDPQLDLPVAAAENASVAETPAPSAKVTLDVDLDLPEEPPAVPSASARAPASASAVPAATPSSARPTSKKPVTPVTPAPHAPKVGNIQF
jgi:serine/threonine-protein kinase